MELAQFCDHRYQELVHETRFQKEDAAYDVWNDCETKAVHQVLNSYRVFLKWAFVGKVLFDYIGVCLEWQAPPKPALKNALKKQKLKEKDKNVPRGTIDSVEQDNVPRGTFVAGPNESGTI